MNASTTTTTPLAIDNGADSIVLDVATPDNRSAMLASAAAIASETIGFEAKVGDTAKAWGHSLFLAVYRDNANLDALIGDSKIAAGWQTLSVSDGGKKAKGRLEVYFSNARLVAERWSALTEEQRDAVLDGTSSIHYLAGTFRKADADAKKAAAKEEAANKAKEEAANSASETGLVETPVEGLSLAAMVEQVLNFYANADEAARDEAAPALALLFEAVNADYDMVGATVTEEAKAA